MIRRTGSALITPDGVMIVKHTISTGQKLPAIQAAPGLNGVPLESEVDFQPSGSCFITK